MFIFYFDWIDSVIIESSLFTRNSQTTKWQNNQRKQLHYFYNNVLVEEKVIQWNCTDSFTVFQWFDYNQRQFQPFIVSTFRVFPTIKKWNLDLNCQTNTLVSMYCTQSSVEWVLILKKTIKCKIFVVESRTKGTCLNAMKTMEFQCT